MIDKYIDPTSVKLIYGHSLNEILAKIDETGVKDTAYVDESKISTKVAMTELAYDEEIHISYSYGPWSVNSKAGPLLSVEWGQRDPFNAYIPKNCTNHSSGKAPVGCVAVSTSYILTYWLNKKNVNFTLDGYTINSKLLCRYTCYPNNYDGAASNNIRSSTTAEANTARYQVAHLMERIGSRLNMDYECNGSGTSDSKATAYLRDIGFTGGYKTDYNVNTILSSLDNNSPVMIGGYSTKNHFLGISWLYSLSGGHSWVLDGYLRRARQVTVTVTKTTAQEALPILKSVANKILMKITTTTTSTYTEYSPYYIHNNWGNYSGNGYFVVNSFDSNNAPVFSSNTKSGKEYNYQFGVDIFPNISFNLIIK